MNYGLLIRRKTGKVVRVVTAEVGVAQLKLYGLANTTPTTDYLVLTESGNIEAHFEGRKGKYPFLYSTHNNHNISEFYNVTMNEIKEALK